MFTECKYLRASSIARVALSFEPTAGISTLAAVRSSVGLCVPDAEISWVAAHLRAVRKILDKAPVRVAFDRAGFRLVVRTADEPVGEGARLVEEDFSLLSDLSLVYEGLSFNSTAKTNRRVG